MKHLKLLLLLILLLPLASVRAELIDPTAPSEPGLLAKDQRGDGGWELHSTLINSHRRVAMINGSPVLEGDRIDGARVLQILPAEVQLETLERRITLRLLANPLRTHAQP